MDAIGFFELAKKPFAFGKTNSNLQDILGQRTLEHIHRKFKEEPIRLAIALRETVRFLYLAAHSPRSLFFPGDKLMDDLWHALVIETKDYQILCDRLNPGSFVHHSGVPFTEYASTRSDQEIHEEQCSWLASYLSNFGPIDALAAPHLNLAQYLAQRLKGDWHSVNKLGQELLKLANSPQKRFDFDEFVEELASIANEIDRHPTLMNQSIRDLVSRSGNLKFETYHLEKLFGASTAFAFTFWQHLAASERLQGLEEWQIKNPDLWKQIEKNEVLVGLATTHLANPAGPGITAEITDDGFLLTGAASWVCGYNIFDKLLIGFETGDSIYFAITDFPANGNNTSISTQEMACLRGSATVRIQFDQLKVDSDQIVSHRLKSNQPPAPRPTSYVIPELGIAKRALRRISKLIEGSTHPKHQLAEKHLPVLVDRLNQIELLRSESAPLDVLIPLRDELNHDSIRLLALSLGARSILPENHIPRIQCELLLLDAVIHSPASFDSKIEKICKGRS